MLTRKDYRTLATLIAEAIMNGELGLGDSFLWKLQNWLESDNPKFSGETFWQFIDDKMEEHKSQ